MFDRIEEVSPKKLVGKSMPMSLMKNKTHELWQNFMTQRKNISSVRSPYLYSMQVYDPSLNFKDFNPHTTFIKWAAIEVTDYTSVPEVFDTYELSGGLYAVFIHKGLPRDFPRTAQYIFSQWIPHSNYMLDSREHFELLKESYRPDDPETEEEVWIPIKSKINP